MFANETAHIKKLIRNETLTKIFNSLGHLQLFKYELMIHANDLVIKIKFLQPSNNVAAKAGIESQQTLSVIN